MRRNGGEPLGLPRGSIRAMIALLVAGPMPVVVILACLGWSLGTEVMAFYTAVVFLVLRDYFSSREADTKGRPVDEPTTYASDKPK